MSFFCCCSITHNDFANDLFRLDMYILSFCTNKMNFSHLNRFCRGLRQSEIMRNEYKKQKKLKQIEYKVKTKKSSILHKMR